MVAPSVRHDKVTVKGKTEPVTLFTTFSPQEAESREAEFAEYRKALRLYRDREFSRAGDAFSSMRKEFREIMLYRLYQDRCANLMRNPPGPEWDQVYAFKVK